MLNQELSKIFSEIALYLEMESVPFKPQAYEKAAMILETLSEDVKDIFKKQGREAIENIPGVGKSIADKIIEYIESGKIKYYEDYKKKIPVNIGELTAVEGLGPKRVKILWEKLKIKNLEDLEEAVHEHKIKELFGFDEKSERNILQGIKFLKKSTGRFLLGDILPKAKEIEERLKRLKEIERISVGGSVRRRKETIGDVDFLITVKDSGQGRAANPVRNKVSNWAKKIMDFFVSFPGVVKIWGKGTTKSSVRMTEGFDVDLRVVQKRSYGSALQYFTGSKEHNIVLRRIAIERGLKLSEYGLFKGPKMIAGEKEEDIYKSLGMNYIEPEIRENRGEIEASLEGKLPKIIGYKDILGDLHCHSNWDGGDNSIEEIVQAAIKMGYEYVGIADHTKFLRIEHGLNEKQLVQQREEIEKLNKKFQVPSFKFQVLQGCEANIMNDGSIDIKDEALAKLDFVIAGVHSKFKMQKGEMTKRIITAMENPNVDIISHPTGRILKKRDEYEVDFDAILKMAKETETILEINSYPARLDLNDINIKKAKEAGVKMVINTDSHHIDQMRYIEFGIAQTRRGWAEKEDIINTQPLEKIINFFKRPVA